MLLRIVTSGVMGIAWLGAALVLLCSTVQLVRLLRKSNRRD
jgi:hypothetical protein